MKKNNYWKFTWILLALLFACKGNSNKETVNNIPENVIEQGNGILSVIDLLELSEHKDLSGVQLYMKKRSTSFIHAKKGEFAAFRKVALTDTAGENIELTASVLYVATDPMADWRIAHIIHSPGLNEAFMNDLKGKGFELSDSSGSYLMKAKSYYYDSKNHPGKRIVFTRTFLPWLSKGIYVNKVTWPCFVYEVQTK
jgi:hypothetical protein